MTTYNVDDLLRNQNQPCISIIMPTDRINKKKNYEVLKKSIQKAKSLLKSKSLPEDTTRELYDRIETIGTHIPEELYEGIGFYFSLDQHAIVTFPFEVKPHVAVDNSFCRRDLLFLKQFSTPYYVLNLSKKGVHLLKGVLNKLTEVKNEKFPFLYEDQFEYAPAAMTSSSSSSLKSYEKEKSQITEIRLRSVFREADASLKPLLMQETKLLLAGTQKMISLFMSVMTIGNHLAGKVAGSYNETNIVMLRDKAWSAYYRINKIDIDKQIKSLREKRNGHLAEGIEDAWAASDEGKGLILLLEKDFHHRGYRKEGQHSLQLQPPKKPYNIIQDAVEELIESIRSRNGKLLLTDNGQLKEFNHVALVLRY